MLPLITTHTHIPKPHDPLSRLHYPLIRRQILMHNPQNMAKRFSLRFGLRTVRTCRKLEGNFAYSRRCCCRKFEGDAELEEEIMEFVEKSEKPMMFPTREELLRGGRMDLVEAIKKRGGWYSLGWDEENVGDNVDEAMLDFDIGEFQGRIDNSIEIASLRYEHARDNGLFSEVDSDSGNLNSLHGSLETDAGEDSGIEGIMGRLEKQRKRDFTINSSKNRDEIHGTSKDEAYERHFNAALDVASFSKNEGKSNKQTYHDGMSVTTTEEYAEADINHTQILTRLRHLELELHTALHSLRSKNKEGFAEKVVRSSSDLQKLSDAWEFQQTEFMSGQERLRSIRAKLAVVEGKMALAITNAQRLVEEKQKRIDEAHKALQLLRTACIVWPVSASEVLLAGSFDGWTSQRKMEKSRAGIFSVSLKLYPGKYEIKFIVDGEWRVDPLRPIINNNGYKNNLLVIT